MSSFTLDITISHAVLTSGGSQTASGVMLQPGTLVAVEAIAGAAAINDTGHFFINFADGSSGLITFLDPPSPPLAANATLVGTVSCAGIIPASTAIIVSTNGLTSAGGSAAATVRLFFYVVDAVDWRGQVAAIAGLTGNQYQEAIIQVLGSSRIPVEWREAIVEHLGTGYAAVDWRQAVQAAYPGIGWEAAIVTVLSNL
jgi:hypothetical protein